MADPGGENKIYMIKPCFLQYPIFGSPDEAPSGNHGCAAPTVGDNKQALIDTLAILRQHPDKFFVLVTAPPKKEDGMTYGENARAVANWMVHELLDGYDVGNVFVYDLFNVLTSNAEGEGDACQEWASYPENPASGSDVGQETGNHHRIWNGEVQHQVQYDQTYSADCHSHPPKHATYKMTQEFVPLLNAYYNAWVSGSINTQPAEEPSPTQTPIPVSESTATFVPTIPPTMTATAVSTPTPIPVPTTPAAPTSTTEPTSTKLPTARPASTQIPTDAATMTPMPTAVSRLLPTQTIVASQAAESSEEKGNDFEGVLPLALGLGSVGLVVAVIVAIRRPRRRR
jgi:hypothetical protein